MAKILQHLYNTREIETCWLIWYFNFYTYYELIMIYKLHFQISILHFMIPNGELKLKMLKPSTIFIDSTICLAIQRQGEWMWFEAVYKSRVLLLFLCCSLSSNLLKSTNLLIIIIIFIVVVINIAISIIIILIGILTSVNGWHFNQTTKRYPSFYESLHLYVCLSHCLFIRFYLSVYQKSHTTNKTWTYF